MAKNVKPIRFSEEEKRVRKHIIDRGVKQKEIADALGITKQDVCNVVCGISRSPRYVKAVYDYIGLDVPEEYGKERCDRMPDRERVKTAS